MYIALFFFLTHFSVSQGVVGGGPPNGNRKIIAEIHNNRISESAGQVSRTHHSIFLLGVEVLWCHHSSFMSWKISTEEMVFVCRVIQCHTL